ncbi:hypothetical protein PYW07_017121 [Mythimna separata]|uniref:Fucosyltransferase n=1 Tax=Mythimna separata TaxID=271217 RepID=A0AAD8DXE7_MYTSE|nr:hypothetical protein PYW07_017121 [Mythimna separata]
MIYHHLVAVRRKVTNTKAVLFIVICVFMFIPLGSYLHDVRTQFRSQNRKEMMNTWHTNAVEGFFGLHMGLTVSKLGGILFNREEIPNPNPNANRTFVVLVWKYWNWIKRRHVFNYGSRKKESDVLEDCSVKNCVFSGNDSLIDTADAVLIHMQKGAIPTVKNRNRTQRWIFLNDESPTHAFSLASKKPTLESLYDVFNWSMTYRSDADVPVPYGRVVPRRTPLFPEYKSLEDIAAVVPNWGRKKAGKIAAVLMSNCGAKARNRFLKALRQYVKVDVFGGCSDVEEFKHSCPGHFTADCDPVAEYLFYLVLENSSCYQYLTEKAFYHAYSKGAIPIVFGPSLEDVEMLLPPDSYLYADEDTNIETLARDINAIARNSELILAMHMWRNHFKVVNEHGYFGTESFHMCRVCEALNYNDAKEKVYDKPLLDAFLDPARSCYDKKSNK